MEMISFKLSKPALDRLDALAKARGINRSRALRQVLEEASMTQLERAALPDEEELLALLAEKARAGNVAAIRALLEREEKRRRAEEAADAGGDVDLSLVR